MHTDRVSERYDLIVVGGGLTGLALANAIGSAGFRVLVIERAPLARLVSAPYDGRVTAVARGSRRFLARIGAWEAMAEAAEPIRDIVVREGFSPIQVHYDHREVGDEPLGHIVENRVIRTALLQRAQALPSVTLAAPAEVAGLELTATRAEVRLADGRLLLAPLVALCEGRQSSTRKQAGIEAREWSYGQTGIVCTIRHTAAACRARGRAVLSGRPLRPIADDRQSLLDRLGAGQRPRQDRAGAGRHRFPGRDRRPVRRRSGRVGAGGSALVLPAGPGDGRSVHRHQAGPGR